MNSIKELFKLLDYNVFSNCSKKCNPMCNFFFLRSMSSKVSADSASVGFDCPVCRIKMVADAFTFPSSLISLQ